MIGFGIVDKEYGKSGVKLLYVAKSGLKHSIQELEVETLLTLDSEKDYREGDNSDIVATDSQKNTVYILAKQHGVQSPEQFGLLLAKHFLDKYNWVDRAKITVSQLPWSRIQSEQGKEHNHAFQSVPTYTRVAEVVQHRTGNPTVTSGIRGLTVIKTTQSSFVNFVRDEYRSLPDMEDRIFSTIVTTDWMYGNLRDLNFDKAFGLVKSTILEKFAGPSDIGIYSPSVQQTQYIMQKSILEKIPQVKEVKITMPNRHYFPVDLSKFPITGLDGEGAGQVLLPVDKPSGKITSTLSRSSNRAKL